jgi:hypothetical protein
MQIHSPQFKQRAAEALVDPGLQKALGRAKQGFQVKRAAAVAGLPEFEALRDIGTGDLSVGKKIRKMGEAFYGRAKAYDEALQVRESVHY